MKKILLFVLSLNLGFLFPCSNEYEEILGIDRYNAEPNFSIGEVYINESEVYSYIAANTYLIDNLEKEASDVAISYLYLKKYKRALQITSSLIKKYPSEYNVVITYAVCLELDGQYAEALKYLRKALELNPQSHWGSEWIHEKILELAVAKQDIQGKSVLGLDFGADSIPTFINQGYDIDKLAEQLEYQIEDRQFFVDSTNIVLGSMFFDFANLVYLHGDTLASKQYFEMAKEKGFRHPMINIRIKHITDWDKRTSAERHNKYKDTYYNDYRDPYEVANRIALLIASLMVIIAGALTFVFILVRKKNA